MPAHGATPAATDVVESSSTDAGGEVSAQTVTRRRHNFLQLQALVSVVLSYQLLFSENAAISQEGQIVWIFGLLLVCAALMILPARLINADWFPGALAIMDTGITSLLIYLSGNASSDLYLAYFVIILIVTASPTAKQLTAFLALVTLIYGWALYKEVDDTGGVFTHHLLRIPLLLVMAIFYRQTADSLRFLTYYDPVTGLPNRRHLVRIMNQEIGADRMHDQLHAVLLLDLDGFKLINDTLGQTAGDHLLRAVATRLKDCLRTTDLVARLGGDEFSVLLHNVRSPEITGRLAQRLLDAFARPFVLVGQEVFVTACIGIAISTQKKQDADELMRNANAALHRAKTYGTNSYAFYSPDMNAQGFERLMLETRLRKAVERNEIVVYYQAQVDLATRQIIGVEALARWQDPLEGLISPAKFIPLAEDTGLIVQIGESVLRQACQQLRAWHQAGYRSLQLSVNMSARQFKQSQLVKTVTDMIAGAGVEPRHVDLELTESCIMQDAETALRTLKQLKEMGIQISVDDFGTGYSSLMYLRRFPIDTLKIDRAFTMDMTTSPDARAITAAIIAMADALKLHVIAEGVETDEQVTLLRQQGCHSGQGFLFSRPIPAAEMTRLFETWPSPVGSLRPRPHVVKAIA
jgi:diguanylate cyclase (GGDEF)-like protein